MSSVDGKLEVRCFCRRKPLLAICGRDTKSGEPFIHIRSAKGDKLNVEVVITSGTARVRCRECERWHKIRIKHVNIESEPEELPSSLKLA